MARNNVGQRNTIQTCCIVHKLGVSVVAVSCLAPPPNPNTPPNTPGHNPVHLGQAQGQGNIHPWTSQTDLCTPWTAPLTAIEVDWRESEQSLVCCCKCCCIT